MNPLEKLLGRLYRSTADSAAAELAVYECANCGCTYDSGGTPCRECWNERLVRIR